MIAYKKTFLFVSITYTVLFAYADYKRFIIRVPQKTKYIYQHHVKKVPIYVLLPERKPKILDDLEEVTKPISCKDSPSWQEDRPLRQRYAGNKDYGNRNVHYSSNNNYIEDKENKGAYLYPDEKYKVYDQDFFLNSPADDTDALYRRTNRDTFYRSTNVNDYNDPSTRNHFTDEDYSSYISTKGLPSLGLRYYFTYPSSVNSATKDSNQYAFYNNQHQISDRMDTNSTLKK